MQISVKRIVAPTDFVLSPEMAATMVRADPTDPKAAAYLQWLIQNATDWCETASRRQFCTATWRQKLMAFPPYAPDDPNRPRYFEGLWPYAFSRSAWGNERFILLAKPPLQATGISVQYVDPNGVTQTLDPSRYDVDADCQPGRISEAYGFVWPATREQFGAVTITFNSGYGAAADVPGRIAQAVAFLVAHWWANREAAVVGFISSEVELTLTRALTSFTRRLVE